MSNSISIREYTPRVCSHSHEFHQVVLPLRGMIDISLAGFSGVVGIGQIVIIQRGVEHSFHAERESRFLVADLEQLPDKARSLSSPFASISRSMQLYCQFIEIQLQHKTNSALENGMLEVFNQLLGEQDFVAKIDTRITRTLDYIEQNLALECSLDDLAAQARLSKSHFKIEFSRQTGMSSGKYLTMRRMEKARALLSHTDLPVQLVAERVGYTSLSAFSRRFSRYFGQSPRRFMSAQDPACQR